MSRDLTNFVQETFDELLYKKKVSMRCGFDIKGEKPLCLVPHRQFSQFMNSMFLRAGYDHYYKNPRPSIEYMGFILVSSDIDDVMFAVQI